MTDLRFLLLITLQKAACLFLVFLVSSFPTFPTLYLKYILHMNVTMDITEYHEILHGYTLGKVNMTLYCHMYFELLNGSRPHI